MPSCCPVNPTDALSLRVETTATSFRKGSCLMFQANAPDGKNPHLLPLANFEDPSPLAVKVNIYREWME